MMTKRDLHLDSLRGLAALLVFASHAGGAYDTHLYNAMQHTFDLGQVGVVIFFLTSGWIIPQSIGRGWRVFWARRFFRLYPLYWVNILLLGGALPVVLINLTMLQGFLGVPHINSAAWTLTVELAFYALVTIAPKATPTRMILLLLTTQACLDLFTPSVWPMASYLAILYAGSALRERQPASALLCLLFVAFTPRAILGEPAHVWARVVGFGVFWLAMRYSFAPHALVWAGERSYSIYLMHTIAMGVLPVILWLPGTLALSALTYAGIEKPAIVLSHFLTNQHRTHAALGRIDMPNAELGGFASRANALVNPYEWPSAADLESK
jgi:peptidoglycan/LPS O-acetylase OafA/YrhL